MDARSDQFSLGATFWHIMSGFPPFPGKSSKEVVLRRFENPSPDIREYADHISGGTAFLLKKMMATDPDDRYPNFQAVASEIEEIMLELETYEIEEEERRERLEEEAHVIQHEEMKGRVLVVGCVIVATIIGYIYFTWYR